MVVSAVSVRDAVDEGRVPSYSRVETRARETRERAGGSRLSGASPPEDPTVWSSDDDRPRVDC